jgi:phage terminase large subunit-like protein
MTTQPPETSMQFDWTSRDAWMSLSPQQRLFILNRLRAKDLHDISACWKLFAHAHQTPPPLAPNGRPWLTWLMIGGRGAGKARAGAEWIRAQALGLPPFAGEAASRIALVGETEHEVREVMIEGVSGLLAVHPPHERPLWLPSRKRLEWSNGAVAQAFSAEDPESLRGPQFCCAWSDELAKWRHAEAAFDMLQFGLRLGSQPRQLITTTPRPTALLKRLLDDCRVAEPPDLQRIVVAVDPPVSSGKRADCCGIVAAGIAESGTVYVLADGTVSAVTPAAWAMKAIALWRRLQADALVVEINQGGEMVPP